MEFYDLNEFLRLSAVLNYQFSAKQVDWHNILTIILGKNTLSESDRKILLEVLEYLSNIYGQKKRRLGSLSVLHPLRASVLLSRALVAPNLLDIMTELLHDNFEDFKPKHFSKGRWNKFDAKFQTFMKKLSRVDQSHLKERLRWLTKGAKETYYQYIGRMLKQAQDTPEVVRIKLADRLDNTLDMRIDLEDPLKGVDFFETIFQMMFTNSYPGYNPEVPHPIPSALNGAQRLYQLFKNIVLISLLRQKKFAIDDSATTIIFDSLVKASMKEAQRIALHIFGYHEKSIKKIRELIHETMIYVQQGGIDSITSPTTSFPLDGLFMSRFDHPERIVLQKNLADLYKNKPLMIEAAIAFVVIFLSFLNDPHYFVRGISEKGVLPETSLKRNHS